VHNQSPPILKQHIAAAVGLGYQRLSLPRLAGAVGMYGAGTVPEASVNAEQLVAGVGRAMAAVEAVVAAGEYT
jgi:hypothetical protein